MAQGVTPITLFEYGEVEYDWTDRDLAAVERLNAMTGAEVLHAAVRGSSRRVLQARQFVGVARLGQRTVQILPKVYRAQDAGDERSRAQEATRNLLYMLADATGIPVHEQSIAPLLQRGHDWFEILTHLFAAHLADEWRRGAQCAFFDCEDELPVLKGKWRVSEHLRQPAQRQRFPVTYADLSADNGLNRVFRYVVERLWAVTREDANRRQLADLRAWMGEVTLLPLVTAQDARPELITRLNRRYEPLLNLARVFLGHGTLQLAAGEVNVFGLLLDMNLLFQEFIVNMIARYRMDVLPPDLAACELLPQSHGAVQHLARRAVDGGNVFPLYPDLAFRLGGRFPLLLDTKYKTLNPASKRSGVSQDDFYQMFTYARRYACPRVVLIYPQTTGEPPLRQSFELHGDEGGIIGEIEAATVNLQINLRTERRQLISELNGILSGNERKG